MDRKKRCILDVLILISLAVFAFFLWFTIQNTYIRFFFILLCAVFFVFWCFRTRADFRLNRLNLEMKRPDGIVRELALLNEEGRTIKTWFIYGMPSVIIGKSTFQTHADVDLKDTEYQSLIDPEHALLNYTTEGWLLEDNDSRNGVSIQKNIDNRRYYLSKREPVLVELGDILYIANTRLLVC